MMTKATTALRHLLGAGFLLAGTLATPAPAAAVPVIEAAPGPHGYFNVPVPNPPRFTGTVAPGITTIDPRVPGGSMANASSVALQVEVTTPAAFTLGAIEVYRSDRPSPDVSAVQFVAGETHTSFVVVELGAGKQVAIENTGSVAVTVKVTSLGWWGPEQCDWYACALTYHGALNTPQGATIADLRTGSGPLTTLGERRTITPSLAGIPTDGSAKEGVFVTTVVPPASPVAGAGGTIGLVAPSFPGTTGYQPDFVQRLDFTEDRAAQKVMTVPLDPGGTVDLWLSAQTAGGRALPIVTALGWMDAAGAFHPVTRRGPGTVAPTATVVAGSPGTPASFDVQGLDGVPAATSCWATNNTPCTTLVELQVTASAATANGTVVAHGPALVNTGLTTTGTPQLSVRSGRTTENTVLAPVDPVTGRVSLAFDAPAGATASLRIEVLGWMEHSRYGRDRGARFTATAPTQVWQSWWTSDVAGTVRHPVVTGATTGVPTSGASQVLVDVQAWGAAGPATVTAWGEDRLKPATPTLSLPTGGRDSTMLAVDVGTDGKISVEVGGSQVFLQVSVIGWFTPYAGDRPTTDGAKAVAVIGDSITDHAKQVVNDVDKDQVRLNQVGLTGYETNEVRWWASQLSWSRPTEVIVNLGTNDYWDHNAAGTWSYGEPASRVLTQFQHYRDQFPGACLYAVTAHHSDAYRTALEGLAATDPRVGFIDWKQFVDERDEPVDSAATRTRANLLADRFVHPSTAGKEALALLYDQATTGSAETAGTVWGSAAMDPIDWASYVTPC